MKARLFVGFCASRAVCVVGVTGSLVLPTHTTELAGVTLPPPAELAGEHLLKTPPALDQLENGNASYN